MPTDPQTLQTLIGVPLIIIIAFTLGGVVYAAVLLLRRAPNAANQVDAFRLADGVLKTNAELSAEIREDGKRREAANVAHIAAMNANTEVLKTIAEAQKKDTSTLTNVHTAVTTQADARHSQVMGAFDIQAGFYPAVIEEIRMVKREMNSLSALVKNRKYSKPAPIRGALTRIEKRLEKITNETLSPNISYAPSMAYVRPMPFDWRSYIHTRYGANPQPVPAGNGNGHSSNAGWNTNDA